jgi:glycosyltransferase involved in cell wall biosynthesis
MKILIVSATDIEGGAGRAAFRLHNSLLESDIDSSMLVHRKNSLEQTVIGPSNILKIIIRLLRSYIDSFPLKFYKHKSATMFSILWLPFSSIPYKINKINPDIVHIHWLGPGMIALEDFSKINAPMVWSLHDMWAFTGGCHYNENCNRFQIGCGNCKVLGSSKENDLSRKVFRQKDQIYKKINNLTIVGLSNWITKSSKKNDLFNNRRVVNLPNPIDIKIFKPFDKINARNLLGLSKGKKLILFGAMAATSDVRKGFQELSETLMKLNGQDIELVVFGSKRPSNNYDFGFKANFLGHINDEETLASLYSAADLMVVPSLQENLSNSIMESLACGTPVVAFNIGGNSDMIDHKKNGYLSTPLDTASLKSGIEWVLNSPNYSELCENAREKVIQKFNSKVISKKYIQLYEEILK